MDPEWVRSLRDQCLEAGIAFHFKQWGNWRPVEAQSQFIGSQNTSKFGKLPASFQNLGKKRAGRDLDGRHWDEFPPPTNSATTLWLLGQFMSERVAEELCTT